MTDRFQRQATIAAGVLALFLTAGAAAARRDVHADDLRPVGKPVDCISQSQIDRTDVRDDRTIDFYMRGRRIYRNSLPDSCPELGFERAFVHRTPTNDYCSTDTITVFRTGTPIPGATCGLGMFQPMERAAPAR